MSVCEKCRNIINKQTNKHENRTPFEVQQHEHEQHEHEHEHESCDVVECDEASGHGDEQLLDASAKPPASDALRHGSRRSDIRRRRPMLHTGSGRVGQQRSAERRHVPPVCVWQ